MPKFYLSEDANNGANDRYDLTKFMPFESIETWKKDSIEGIYDELPSYFLTELMNLPIVGKYTIKTPFRPDIYANEVFENIDYSVLLLRYNSIININDLVIGKDLYVFDIADLENLLLLLKAKGGNL